MSISSFSAVSRTSGGSSPRPCTAAARRSEIDGVKLLEAEFAKQGDEARHQGAILDDREPALERADAERRALPAQLGDLALHVVATAARLVRGDEEHAALGIAGLALQREPERLLRLVVLADDVVRKAENVEIPRRV